MTLRVIVTGAAGYIGRHVVTALLDRGAEVVAVRRSGDRPVDVRATSVELDIFAQRDQLLEAAASADVVLHLAWEAGFVHNSPVHVERLGEHYALLTALAALPVSRLAVLGSMHEVGYHVGAIDAATPTNPLSLYGVAKNSLRQALEIGLRGSGVDLLWLRCFYITGDDENNQSIFTKIAQAAERGDRRFPFTSGTNRFDFLDVCELADQISAAALQDVVTGIINCCSGEPVALRDRVEQFIAARGYDLTLDFGSFPDRPYDSPGMWGDPTAIRQILAASAARRPGVVTT